MSLGTLTSEQSYKSFNKLYLTSFSQHRLEEIEKLEKILNQEAFSRRFC